MWGASFASINSFAILQELLHVYIFQKLVYKSSSSISGLANKNIGLSIQNKNIKAINIGTSNTKGTNKIILQYDTSRLPIKKESRDPIVILT